MPDDKTECKHEALECLCGKALLKSDIEKAENHRVLDEVKEIFDDYMSAKIQIPEAENRLASLRLKRNDLK